MVTTSSAALEAESRKGDDTLNGGLGNDVLNECLGHNRLDGGLGPATDICVLEPTQSTAVNCEIVEHACQ